MKKNPEVSVKYGGYFELVGSKGFSRTTLLNLYMTVGDDAQAVTLTDNGFFNYQKYCMVEIEDIILFFTLIGVISYVPYYALENGCEKYRDSKNIYILNVYRIYRDEIKKDVYDFSRDYVGVIENVTSYEQLDRVLARAVNAYLDKLTKIICGRETIEVVEWSKE